MLVLRSPVTDVPIEDLAFSPDSRILAIPAAGDGVLARLHESAVSEAED